MCCPLNDPSDRNSTDFIKLLTLAELLDSLVAFCLITDFLESQILEPFPIGNPPRKPTLKTPRPPIIKCLVKCIIDSIEEEISFKRI